jgi:hypothetical protein
MPLAAGFGDGSGVPNKGKPAGTVFSPAGRVAVVSVNTGPAFVYVVAAFTPPIEPSRQPALFVIFQGRNFHQSPFRAGSIGWKQIYRTTTKNLPVPQH